MNQLNNVYVERVLIKDRQSELLQLRRFERVEKSSMMGTLRAHVGAAVIRSGEFIRGRAGELAADGSEDTREAALHIAA